ncbi:hypothetical protein ACLOJK_030918 [Asimina triloba]
MIMWAPQQRHRKESHQLLAGYAFADACCGTNDASIPTLIRAAVFPSQIAAKTPSITGPNASPINPIRLISATCPSRRTKRVRLLLTCVPSSPPTFVASSDRLVSPVDRRDDDEEEEPSEASARRHLAASSRHGLEPSAEEMVCLDQNCCKFRSFSSIRNIGNLDENWWKLPPAYDLAMEHSVHVGDFHAGNML